MLEVFVTLSFSIDFLSRCRAGAQVLAGGEVVKVSSEKDPMGSIELAVMMRVPLFSADILCSLFSSITFGRQSKCFAYLLSRV